MTWTRGSRKGSTGWISILNIGFQPFNSKIYLRWNGNRRGSYLLPGKKNREGRDESDPSGHP
jgi:hypothetical protein